MTATGENKLRVLHLNTERTWRGGENQVLSLAKGLARRGHDSVVAAQPGSPLLARAQDAGLETEALETTGEWDLGAIRLLARILQRRGTQVIHMHTSHACSIGGWAARWAGVPVRLISRRVDFSIRANPFRRLKYEWGVDRILAISQGVRKVLVDDGIDPAKIIVVYSGIDPGRFDPELSGAGARAEFGIGPNDPVVGCVAHFADHKGHRYLVEAVPRVRAALPNVRFLLVGAGELLDQVKHQADNLSLSNTIIFPGFRSDVPRLLAAMDVVAMASHHEGLGTSLLDALAMARPVVSTRVGGIPEIVEDGENGRLVPPRDPEALAAALIGMLNAPEERRRMGAAGRKRVVERFSVEAMVANTEAVYGQMLAAVPRPTHG